MCSYWFLWYRKCIIFHYLLSYLLSEFYTFYFLLKISITSSYHNSLLIISFIWQEKIGQAQKKLFCNTFTHLHEHLFMYSAFPIITKQLNLMTTAPDFTYFLETFQFVSRKSILLCTESIQPARPHVISFKSIPETYCL